ncbi:MAG: hexose kinase [Thermomicrobiales bacterium]|nr:hexose kinase [Thermomicrobiales bacterium]
MSLTPIATITLNASVDTTYLLPRLEHGGIAVVDRKEAVAGGKGNNVARVLTTLGQPAIATGFVGGDAGRFIEESLRAAGIATAFHHVSGESRTCLTIVEEANGTVSEIRERGEVVRPEDGAAFLRAAPTLVGAARWAVLSGSLPPGLPADYYARLVAALKAAGLRVVLDASGEPAALALAAGPDVIAPNLEELSALVGRPVAVEDAVAAAHSLFDRLGSDAVVLVTFGAGGAALVRRDRALTAGAATVDAINPVGAGDAFLAGYVAAAAGGADDATALRAAVATGSAATLQTRIGVVDPADVARLCDLVGVVG